jgi:hypothetical protein
MGFAVTVVRTPGLAIDLDEPFDLDLVPGGVARVWAGGSG